MAAEYTAAVAPTRPPEAARFCKYIILQSVLGNDIYFSGAFTKQSEHDI